MRINQFFENQREKSGRLDTIVGYIPLVSQIIALRSLPFDLNNWIEKVPVVCWIKKSS